MFDQNIYKLLKLLRGETTQKQMACELGLKSNAYYKWEAGYKKITLKEFIDILSLKGINFYQLVKDNFNIKDIGQLQNDTVHILENHFPYQTSKFLDESHYSESKWWRLKNHKKDLLLKDFFIILDTRSKLLYRLYEALNFNEFLTDDQTLSSHEKLKRFRHYLKKYSFFAHFSATIYLSHIKEATNEEAKIQLIAKSLNQSERMIKNLIKKLIKDEILVFQNNQYEFIVFENTIPSQMRDIGINLYEHIYRSSLCSIQDATDNAKFHYRVAPVSKNALKKINEIQNKMSKEIYQIINEDSPKDRDMVFSFIHSSTAL